jgi:hypothetical protein
VIDVLVALLPVLVLLAATGLLATFLVLRFRVRSAELGEALVRERIASEIEKHLADHKGGSRWFTGVDHALEFCAYIARDRHRLSADQFPRRPGTR